MTRIGLFVDGANIFYAQRENGWHIDFRKIYEYCKGFGEIRVAYYYTASPHYSGQEDIENYRRFRGFLINSGYTVQDKELKVIKTRELEWVIEIDGKPLAEFIKDQIGSRVEHTGRIVLSGVEKKEMKGNLDVEMALGMVSQANLYDICFLISGDSDFIPVVKHLRHCGKEVIGVARKRSTSFDLINEINRFIDLAEIRRQIEKNRGAS